MTITETRYLTTEQLAERYGKNPITIKAWRWKNYGPPYFTLKPTEVPKGQPRTRYPLNDLFGLGRNKQHYTYQLFLIWLTNPLNQH
tara:strand:- start:338 stop:595 length:258 start_codon:yes stop_codon:yes gene_type:complete